MTYSEIALLAFMYKMLLKSGEDKNVFSRWISSFL